MDRQQTFSWDEAISGAPLPPLVDPPGGIPHEHPLVHCYRAYGPIFRTQGAGSEPQTILAGPEANVFMARHEDEFFTTREHWQQFDAVISQGSESSLTAARDGEANRQRRARSSREWSRARVLDQLEQLTQITTECMQRWQPGARIAVHNQFRRIVAEQLGRLLVGVSPGEYLDDFVIYLNTAIANTLTTGSREQAPGLDAPAYQRAAERVNEFGRLAYEAHLSHPQPNGKPDMIDEAMQATAQYPESYRQAILSKVALGPMLAGIDTVANSLTFMLYALLAHPEAGKRVQAEVEIAFQNGPLSRETLQQMPALNGAMRETLRRYPVAGGHLCRVARPLTINGYRLDPGTDVYVAMTVPHFLEEYYPNPLQFDIDRFQQPRNEHRSPGVFAPFGLGNHTCLGAGIAEVQLQVTMATLLHSRTFHLDPPDYQLSIEEHPTPVPANFFVTSSPTLRHSHS
ncbi:MAG: cytochrome P450 [Ktedonobacteraceae bacterium]|nr:cytochrome P450 [Ktedonobacteraceae bacterium]